MEALEKGLRLLLLGIVTGTAAGQTLPSDTIATVVLGAGKAGAWDTSILVTNVTGNPISITITAQPYGSLNCALPPCNTFATATIPALGTFALPFIPEPDDPRFSNGPQALYVLSPSNVAWPAVTAVASDGGATCNRSVALPVAIGAPGAGFANGFANLPLVFPISRDVTTHVNLIIMGIAGRMSGFQVDAFDASGTRVGRSGYGLDGDENALMIVDILGQLGLDTLERGALQVTINPSTGGSSFAAVATSVGPNGVQMVQGTRIVDPGPP